MSLHVVKASEPTGMYMTVVIGSNNREELDSPEVQKVAKAYAMQQGFQPRGLADNPLVYPVNEKGESTDGVVTGTEKLAGWESLFRFCAGI